MHASDGARLRLKVRRHVSPGKFALAAAIEQVLGAVGDEAIVGPAEGLRRSVPLERAIGRRVALEKKNGFVRLPPKHVTHKGQCAVEQLVGRQRFDIVVGV